MDSSQTFLISGSSRGVGRLIAKHYLESGNKIFGCSRGPSSIKHPNYQHIRADVALDGSVKTIFDKILDENARIDVLINNAGVSQNQLAAFTSSDAAQQILNTNFLGSFLLMREAIKHMKRNKSGRILNISSINVPLGSIGASVYNASKAAVENLSHTISHEVAGDDITINTLGLSVVAETGMAEEISAVALNRKLAELSKPAFLQIEEIVHVIDFFISSEARNVTNQVLYFGGVC